MSALLQRIRGGRAIRALVLCRGPRCIARTGRLDPECPRCLGLRGETPGVDPVSLPGGARAGPPPEPE